MHAVKHRWLKLAPGLAAAAVLLLLGSCSKEDAQQPIETRAATGNAARAMELAQELLIVDTHIDVPYRLLDEYEDVSQATKKGHFDHPRAVAGGLNASFMSIYTPALLQKKGGAKENADRLIDMVEVLTQRSPEKFAIAYSPDDVRRAFAEGRIALPIGMENGAPLEGEISGLHYFYNRGVRYITLAHSEYNDISDSSYDSDKPNGGLSDFGKEVVREMNRLGVMVDISHLSDDAAHQVLDITSAPVIASHSSVRHFTPGWERNMPDDLIQRLAENGGVIQINFGSVFVNRAANDWAQEYFPHVGGFSNEHELIGIEPEAKAFAKGYKAAKPPPPAYLEDVLNNIDHVVRLVGIDFVGIGSDYDGVSSLPFGLEDVSTYPNLIAGLLGRGYSEEDIEKILGGNIMRVWSAVEGLAEPAQQP